MTETVALLDRYSLSTVTPRPILELGARLWDDERYAAFVTCYQAMRRMDDLVDDARIQDAPLSDADKLRIARDVTATLSASAQSGSLLDDLARVRRHYLIPDWPWERWTEAMVADLDRDGFGTFRDFLRYSEGAAVAPGGIFMHLCGVSGCAGRRVAPSFDVRAAARPVALFCYLTHILRDFRQDQLNGLHYFADDVMAGFGVTRATMRKVAEAGAPTPEWWALVRHYRGYAARQLARAERVVAGLRCQMLPEYHTSLALVLTLYARLFDKTSDADAVALAQIALTAQETLDAIAAVVELQ